ncbi:hypothetical protein ACG04Q_21530 [Roseateles sp. DXS20W]|uniref:Uncharacterized protein n=1 Tax=Pelomonas lactea TaxID=3299030 RepID=A0ABW7GQI0_9BURK
MTNPLDYYYDHCAESAPEVGHYVGFLTGATAAAPFAAATVGESGVPFAWGPGQIATAAAGAAAYELGSQVGTAAGADLFERACNLAMDAGHSIATNLGDWVNNHLDGGAQDAASHDSSHGGGSSGHSDAGHYGGDMGGGI